MKSGLVSCLVLRMPPPPPTHLMFSLLSKEILTFENKRNTGTSYTVVEKTLGTFFDTKRNPGLLVRIFRTSILFNDIIVVLSSSKRQKKIRTSVRHRDVLFFSDTARNFGSKIFTISFNFSQTVSY